MLNKIQSIILAILFAETLGHGRRMEGFLTLAKCFGTIMFLFSPESTVNSKVLWDFYLSGWDKYLFIPFLISGILSAYGLLANINSWPASRTFRFFGAATGFYIWLVYAMKSAAVGDLTTAGFILGLTAAVYGESGTMLYASANLPVIGARGNLGATVNT